MFDVAKNLHEVLDTLPDGVKLVAISKFHPKEYIEVAYREVPFYIFGKTLNLTSQLLFVTFPKYALPFTISDLDILFRMKLTDSNQFHSIRKRIEYFM